MHRALRLLCALAPALALASGLVIAISPYARGRLALLLPLSSLLLLGALVLATVAIAEPLRRSRRALWATAVALALVPIALVGIRGALPAPYAPLTVLVWTLPFAALALAGASRAREGGGLASAARVLLALAALALLVRALVHPLLLHTGPADVPRYHLASMLALVLLLAFLLTLGDAHAGLRLAAISAGAAGSLLVAAGVRVGHAMGEWRPFEGIQELVNLANTLGFALLHTGLTLAALALARAAGANPQDGSPTMEPRALV